MFLCYICYLLITRNNIYLYLFLYYYIDHNQSHILQWCLAVSGVNCDVIKGNATMVTYRGLTFELKLKQSSNLTLNIGIKQQDQSEEHVRVTAFDTCTYMYYRAPEHACVPPLIDVLITELGNMPVIQPLIHVLIAELGNMPVIQPLIHVLIAELGTCP